MESSSGTLKSELVRHYAHQTRVEATGARRSYIESALQSTAPPFGHRLSEPRHIRTTAPSADTPGVLNILSTKPGEGHCLVPLMTTSYASVRLPDGIRTLFREAPRSLPETSLMD
jgi:hypothetical protein